ncbi:MAG: CidA/LrgA family protein [Coriobacteriaceae bacterium]|nr:CidA/LrgA family protein [Coriobacteriaceae bacterium]
MFQVTNEGPRETGASSASQTPSTSPDPATEPERRIADKLKRAGIIALQLVILIAVYGVGCLIANFLPITIPGNIVGMALLLVLLATGLLKAKHVGEACDYMVDNMSIFFIPAGVGIMGCFSLLQEAALKFALVCVVTTVIVFLATSLTVMAVSRIMEKHENKARRNRKAARLSQEA